MYTAASCGHATATDLADYLVRRGVPFRDAHEIVGRTVAYAIHQGLDLAALDLQILQSFSPLIEQDVLPVLTLEGSVAARNHLGGTAPTQVRDAITLVRQRLQNNIVSEETHNKL